MTANPAAAIKPPKLDHSPTMPFEQKQIDVDPVEASRDVYGHWLFAHHFGVLSTPRRHVALWLLERYRTAYILAQDELRNMSAIDLPRQVKARPSTSDVPVVVLSESPDPKGSSWLAGASAVVPSLGRFDLLGAVLQSLARSRARPN